MEADEVLHKITAAEPRYYRLVLVVGPPGSGKTRVLKEISKNKGYPYINLGLSLSQKLLGYPSQTLSRRVQRLVEDIIRETGSGTVILDNTEILFEPTLQLNPLLLLQQVSRNRTVVAGWNGTYDGKVLVYAEAGHPGYRKYYDVDALVSVLGQEEISEKGGVMP